MIVRVKYWNDTISAYAGAEYTYLSDIELKPLEKVLVPVGNEDGLKKAIVTQTDLPSSVLSPSWADRPKKVRGYDR